MHLANQATADREGWEEREAAFERSHVVQNLSRICRLGRKLRLGGKYLAQGRLRAFDSCAGDRFSTDIGPNQDVRVRELPAETGEEAKRPIRVGKRENKLRRELEGPRYRPRMERKVLSCAGVDPDDTAGPR